MRADLARALAAAFLAGEWTQPGLVASGTTVLGRRARWLPPLVRQALELYPRAPLDRPRELAANLASRPAAAKAMPSSSAPSPDQWGTASRSRT